MFSKIKEEKQIMSSRISGLRTPPHNNGSNIKNRYDGSSFNLSKVSLICFTTSSIYICEVCIFNSTANFMNMFIIWCSIVAVYLQAKANELGFDVYPGSQET